MGSTQAWIRESESSDASTDALYTAESREVVHSVLLRAPETSSAPFPDVIVEFRAVPERLKLPPWTARPPEDFSEVLLKSAQGKIIPTINYESDIQRAISDFALTFGDNIGSALIEFLKSGDAVVPVFGTPPEGWEPFDDFCKTSRELGLTATILVGEYGALVSQHATHTEAFTTVALTLVLATGKSLIVRVFRRPSSHQ